MSDEARDAVFELKPLNLADLLDAIVRLYTRYFGRIVRIGAVVYVPLGVLNVVAAALVFQGLDVTGPLPDRGFGVVGLAAYGLLVILFWLSMPLVQAAIAKAVAEYYLGAETSVADAYAFALRRWPSLIAVALFTALVVGVVVTAVTIPTALLIAGAASLGGDAAPVAAVVLGVIVALVMVHVMLVIVIKLFFGPLAVVLEEVGPIHALQRSWELTGGHFWRILVSLGLLWLFVVMLTGIVVWPAQAAAYFVQGIPFGVTQAVLSALSAAAQLLLQPIQIVGTVLIYYDLRMRKEGFDLTMMAEAIGEPQLAARAASGEAQPLFAAPEAPQPLVGTDDEPPDPDQLSRPAD